MRLVDLHTHSTASDGTDRPAAIVDKALALNLSALALTDHDSLDGLAEAEAYRVRHDPENTLDFVRGIELGSLHQQVEIHVLGLWLPEEPERLAELERLLADMRLARRDRNLAMLDKLRQLGLELDYEEVCAQAGGQVVGRPHLAAAMVEKGQAANIGEAFAKYLGREGLAYAPRSLPGPEVCVGVLAEAGAMPCLAHPCLSLKNGDKLETLIQSLLPFGLLALEAYHPEHRDSDVRFCVDMAHKYGLGLSGGSDYHGGVKAGIKLGVGRGGLRVPDVIYRELKALHARSHDKDR